MFLLILVASAGFHVVDASCVLTKNCWNSGCTATVAVNPWKAGAKVKISVGDGGKIQAHEIWNAKFVSENGRDVTVRLNKYGGGSFGFNVRGTTEVTVSCSNDGGGGERVSSTQRPENSKEGKGNKGKTTISGDGEKTPTTQRPETSNEDKTNKSEGGTSGGGLLKPMVTLKTGPVILTSFLNSLTSVVGKNTLGDIRVVQSSGGVAGGVISEGQGYGLLIAAITAASTSDAKKKAKAIKAALELFNGWKTMCEKSTGGSSCQNGGYCSGSNCLPHWKFDSTLSRVDGTGAAPDGDQDAMLGMLYLIAASKDQKPQWWKEVAQWACDSCKAFMDFNTASGGDGKLTLKLGSCWGGWDCGNPSYYSGAHWRAFRDYSKYCHSEFGTPDYTAKWNNLIKTTYEILEANQCPKTGLITNWWVPSKSNPFKDGSTGCSGSRTPAAEFGAEASRGIWKVAIDRLLYGSEAKEGVGAGEFSARVAKAISSKINNNANLDTGCHVKSVFQDWLNNPFIWAPTATALIVDTKTPNQQEALDKIARKLNSSPIDKYYSGSWIALETLTLNGDLAKAHSKLYRML